MHIYMYDVDIHKTLFVSCGYYYPIHMRRDMKEALHTLQTPHTFYIDVKIYNQRETSVSRKHTD